MVPAASNKPKIESSKAQPLLAIGLCSHATRPNLLLSKIFEPVKFSGKLHVPNWIMYAWAKLPPLETNPAGLALLQILLYYSCIGRGGGDSGVENGAAEARNGCSSTGVSLDSGTLNMLGSPEGDFRARVAMAGDELDSEFISVPEMA